MSSAVTATCRWWSAPRTAARLRPPTDAATVWRRSPRRRRRTTDEHGGQASSEQFRPQRHGFVRRTQHDMALLVMKARHQALRPDRADLFFGEIDHCHDLAADQILRVVVLGDLRAGFAHADFRAKIDMQHMSGIAGLGKGLRVDHFADAQLHLFKVGPFDRLHGSGLVPGSTRRMIRRYAAPCDTASSIWFMRCTKRAGSSSSPP